MNIAPPNTARNSETYKRLVLLALTLVNTVNSADRAIVPIVGQAMKVDLKLTDTQLGLLSGTAFGLLYALSGIPIARVAERINRTRVIAVAVTIWSALTALLGLAGTFWQLIIIRTGVGIGEAGCNPPAHSLLSDYFEPKRRTTVLSIYSCGVSVGYLLAAFLGGFAAQRYGWRTACAAVGLPGLAVALLFKRIVKEPPRTHVEASQEDRARASKGAFKWSDERQALSAVARRLFRSWPVANMIVGVVISTFATSGLYAFVPAFFGRAFALDYGSSAVISGIAGGASVAVGTVAGGYITDFFGAKNAKWYALIPSMGLALCLPLYAMSCIQLNWRTTAILLALAGFFQYVSFGPTFGVVQNVTNSRQRATASAFVYLLLNVIAVGGGALFTGSLIDHFAQFDFAHPTIHSVFDLGASWGSEHIGGPASFRLSCPGGVALPQAGDASQSACRAALVLATRQGMLITVLLYGWSSLHYLIASIGIAKALRRTA